MSISEDVITLAQFLAGEFENKEQAMADPAWYVHLKLWQRPTPLFRQDSITLFVEQANVMQLDRPYRQRLLRVWQGADAGGMLQVQYYGFHNPAVFQGCGLDPDRLSQLTLEDIERLPGCRLDVEKIRVDDTNANTQSGICFIGSPPTDTACFFTYRNQTKQVMLGFQATATGLLSHDKGVDPETGQALWGAILGPFRFHKLKDYAVEI